MRYNPFVSVFLVSLSGMLYYTTFGGITSGGEIRSIIQVRRYTRQPGYLIPDIAVYPIAD